MTFGATYDTYAYNNKKRTQVTSVMDMNIIITKHRRCH